MSAAADRGTRPTGYPTCSPAHEEVVALIRSEAAGLANAHCIAASFPEAVDNSLERIATLLDALHVIDRQRYRSEPAYTAFLIVDGWCDDPDPLTAFRVHLDVHTHQVLAERVARFNRENAEECRAALLAELGLPDPRPSIHHVIAAEIVDDEEEYDHSRAKEDLRNGFGR